MSSVAGRRVLVTGAAGRIGSAATELLTRSGALVTAFVQPGQQVSAADRVVEGDTRNPDEVADALDGVNLLVHLAALPHRDSGSPYDVYSVNVVSTFNVLTQAAAGGVERAVIASSINRYGLPQGSDPDRLPPYFPLDTEIPAHLSDWYSLSKFSDEATCQMVSNRWGMPIVGLRFPHVNTAEALRHQVEHHSAHPASGLTEGWSYLDVRDAARSIRCGLEATTQGAVAFYLAAPTTSSPYATEDLLDAFAPTVPRRRIFVGREVPIDLTDARELIGFEAEHPLAVESRTLAGTCTISSESADSN